ncbi:MAG TPA: hypothetical protein VLE69_02450 [Candidatus Saccharimonadales bacterium]|nr:hypothetical protein [Candidatus Saccharimonadales bacterium]
MKFRRKRTRQRQVSEAQNPNGVFSYYSNNRSANEGQTGRNETKVRRSLKQRFGKVPVLAGLVLIIPLAAYLLTLGSVPKIAPLDSDSSTIGLLRSSDTYQKTATEIYRSSLLNRFKLTLDTNGFEKQMKQKFPELSQAVITQPVLGHTPTIQLRASAPAVLITSQFGDYVLDTGGKAVLKNANKNNVDKLQLLTINDQSNIPIILGRGVLTQEEMNFMRVIKAQLQAQNVPVASMILPPAPNELDVKVQGQAYLVKLDMQNDARESAGAVLAVKQRLDQEHTVPSAYIDARVEGRAYYK